MADLLLVALLALGFGYWIGRHHGFKRGVKACLALASSAQEAGMDYPELSGLDTEATIQ